MEEISRDLSTHYHSYQEEVSKALRAIAPTITELLHEDDRIIHVLEKCESRTPGSGTVPENDCSLLAKKLSEFSCEELHCRLDRIYLEHLERYDDNPNNINGALHTQQEQLKSDLESLYTEINDVVEMSAFQEFESPLLEATRVSREGKITRDETKSRLVC